MCRHFCSCLKSFFCNSSSRTITLLLSVDILFKLGVCTRKLYCNKNSGKWIRDGKIEREREGETGDISYARVLLYRVAVAMAVDFQNYIRCLFAYVLELWLIRIFQRISAIHLRSAYDAFGRAIVLLLFFHFLFPIPFAPVQIFNKFSSA